MKLKKTLSAFGLIAVAASLLAGPAASATVAEPNAANGPRLAGEFLTATTAGHHNVASWAPVSAAEGAGVDNGAQQWTFPMYGTPGPIKPSDGTDRCLTGNRVNVQAVTLDACIGSPAQTWTLSAPDALGQSAFVNDEGWGVTDFTMGRGPLVATNITAQREVLWTSDLVEVVPFALTTPAVGSVVRDARPTFSGVGEAGATIEIEDADGMPIATTTVREDGTWSVRPVDEFAEARHTGEVRHVNADDVVSTTPYDFEYALVQDVAVTSPAIGSSVDLPRPVISGTGQAGAEVELLFAEPNERTYTTTVAANGTWSITPTVSLRRGLVEGQVTQSFEGGTKQSAFNFTYGTVAPVIDVTLAAPVAGATLTDARPVFSGAGQNGATIEVVENGSVIATATVAGGTWTATPAADVALGAHAGSVIQKISGAQQSSVPFSFTREADVVQQPLDVTSPTVGGSIVTGADGRVAPVFSGTATPGAEVKVVTAWGDTVGTVTADATTGVWSLTWNKTLLPATYAGGATIQSIGGNVIDRVAYRFTVTGSLAQAPLVVASPTVNGTIAVDASGTVAPVFSGTATPGAEVKVVTAWGDTVGTVTADATTGAWSLTWNKRLLPSTYAGGNTIQSINGVEIDRAGYRFTVQAAASDVVLTSPAIGGIISTEGADRIAPVFTGTGTDGARIEIVGAWGTALGSGVVRDGVWEITWANQYTPSTYSGGLVKQYLSGESTLHSSVPYNFTITR